MNAYNLKILLGTSNLISFQLLRFSLPLSLSLSLSNHWRTLIIDFLFLINYHRFSLCVRGKLQNFTPIKQRQLRKMNHIGSSRSNENWIIRTQWSDQLNDPMEISVEMFWRRKKISHFPFVFFFAQSIAHHGIPIISRNQIEEQCKVTAGGIEPIGLCLVFPCISFLVAPPLNAQHNIRFSGGKRNKRQSFFWTATSSAWLSSAWLQQHKYYVGDSENKTKQQQHHQHRIVVKQVQ